MNIGITGHQKLKEPSLWSWVEVGIDDFLSRNNKSLVGLSSLAVGADQIFAQSVMKNGGSLYAIIPFDGYDLRFTEETHREEYFHLLNQASQVEVLERIQSDEESYFNAGKKVVDLSDVLLAVWDGKPAAGRGGTGDVVEYAVRTSKKVFHLNPLTQNVSEK